MQYRQGTLMLIKGTAPVNIKFQTIQPPVNLPIHVGPGGVEHKVHAKGGYQFECEWVRIGPNGATLVCKDHADLDLPEGDYEIRSQKEYIPASQRGKQQSSTALTGSLYDDLAKEVSDGKPSPIPQHRSGFLDDIAKPPSPAE